MGYLPLRLAVSGRILGADHITQQQCRAQGSAGVGWAPEGQGRPHWGAAGPRVARRAGSLGRRGILAVDRRRNAALSRTFFTRALLYANFSLRACGGECLPARAAPAGRQLPPGAGQLTSPTSREGNTLRPPCAAKFKSTPGPEPANLFWADLARSRR